MGIPPEEMPYIFDRFYRGQKVGQLNMPGTGLGLSVVKDIISLHNGTVEVESRVDKGTVFRVWLPVGGSG
jgi:two-component system phosphate regulon sensor histidine kinase PhoR